MDFHAAEEEEHLEGNEETIKAIVTDTLSDFQPPRENVEEAQRAWGAFVDAAGSREAAGQAIYEALSSALIGVTEHFKTPRAVQAVRFLVGWSEFVAAMDKPKLLNAHIEASGFHHLQFDVNIQRVEAFRDNMLSLLEEMLSGGLTSAAKDGLSSLFNHVGGALIFVKTHHSGRLKLLAESWAVAHEKDEEAKLTAGINTEAADMSGESGISRKKSMAEHSGEAHATSDAKNGGSQSLPQTFSDMFKMNAAVMGITHIGWMNAVIDQFDNMVTNVTNCYRMQEECDILTLRLAAFEQRDIDLGEFKSCMLAALRSLLPKQWMTGHEVAWNWFWENVSQLLRRGLGRPDKEKEAFDAWYTDLDDTVAFEIRAEIYVHFFDLAPAGQDFFKQSNTRLHFIGAKIFDMISEVYHEPARMVKEISALGLRHVGFGIPIDLFSPFVTASCEVLAPRLKDHPKVLEAYRFAMVLMSRILVRTIMEGSTVVMKAINANSLQQLRRAISSAPRGQRASWLLLVQVGTQNISPFAWAVESGKVEVAEAILKDLLTIRADRDRYYYGVNDLFGRHNDVVKRICEESPMLLKTLLHGLVWRSHRTKNGLRRVNYYVEHVLVDWKGQFSEGLRHITNIGESGVMADPIVVHVTDSLWHGIVYQQFLYSKIWNMVGLCVFELAQGILPKLPNYPTPLVNALIFSGKMFIYVFGMGRLAYQIFAGIYRWSRKELKRIFEEIDEDGSGEIDWEEFVAGLNMFKNLIGEKIMGIVHLLRDDNQVAKVESDKKKVGSKKGKNVVNLMLFGTLVAMCAYEPMWWCSGSPDFPTNECEEAEPHKHLYSIFVMCSMAVHWLVLMDLAVFSTDLSSFLLVIGHVLQEVRQFLTALCFLLMLFGSAICIYCRRCEDEGGDFSDLPNAVTSLLAITIRLYQGDFRDMAEDPLLLASVLISTTFSAVLLLNLLVAQLNLSYEYIYRDMLGFARLNRASLICEAMNLCSRAKWDKFKGTLRLDQKLEFDEGDVGLPGGVSTFEPSGLHQTGEEQIRRYGGTTSPAAPWPEDRGDDQSSRFERLEDMLHKHLKMPRGSAPNTGSAGDSQDRGDRGSGGTMMSSGGVSSSSSGGA